MKQMKQSKTYLQIATGLTVAVPLSFPFSRPFAAILLCLIAVAVLVGLTVHNHDE